MAHGALPGTGDLVVVSEAAIDAGRLAEAVGRPDSGAVVVFLGTVRDSSSGRRGVTALEYEAYAGVAEAEIGRIVAEARDRWTLSAVAAAHRIGRLAVGEVTVGVAVSSPHRPEAFEAARFLIDELKQRVPIWKKEFWADGEEWV
jgi:molybdopterin synthase catalytic subunit